MPDKIQHTAASLQQKMIVRYNDGLPHKHNKHRLEYRQHCRSHPSNTDNSLDEEGDLNNSTGLLRQFKLRKMRKRHDKGQFH
jgi:protoheme ferro-lyase